MYSIFKRTFDLLSALCLLTVISPLFATIAILVRINLGSPIFFRQERSGQNYKNFMLIKFRTMTDSRDEKGKLLPDSQRFTKFGHFLRNSSLDELPELLNIIKGDMAVIGPRPLYPRYNPYFKDSEKSRFNVRSGLIPPESLYHDSFLTWDKQLQYEADYAENVSLTLDAKILISVIKTMLVRNDTDYGDYTRIALDKERSVNEHA